MTRRPVTAAAAVMSVFLLAGCGVPTDREPRPLAKDDVPFGLLDATSTTTTTVATPATTAPVEIFLVAGDRLVPVARHVAAPPSPATTLARLLDGPTREERASGLRTAIAAEAEVEVVTAKAGTVRLDLDQSFAELEGREQVLALAQVVFTATGLQDVDGVVFTLAGKPVEVPTADGTLRTGLLRAAHFDSLRRDRDGARPSM